MRKWIGRAGWAALGVTLAGAVGLASWEPFLAEQPGPPPPARIYDAEIVRDSYGVPHIHGATDGDVAFGVAWAQAEDDFTTQQDVLAMVRGRFGAIAGEQGAGVDFAYHLLDARGTARRHYSALAPEVRAILDGYASGLNRYAALHPREIKLARLFPVNGEDIATGFALRQPFFFGLDRVLKPLAEGLPFRREHGPSLTGNAVPDVGKGEGDQLVPLPHAGGGQGVGPSKVAGPPPAPPASGRGDFPLPMGDAGEMAGSNGFAIAPKRSSDGVTRLLSNSHQPWRGGVAWYEMVVQSDSGWHFAGAGFPGSPFPFLGHNADLGWTNTVNRPDLIDIYKLELDGAKQSYRLDGKWLPLESRRVWLPVRFGPFVVPVPRRVWKSVHGPAMINPRGAFAIRYAGIDSIASIEQYYRLNRARTFAEWQAAMARQAFPAINFVYADKAGNIAYVYNARLPDRRPGPDWRGVVPGNDSSLIWKGPVAWNKVPQIVNPASGFLFNSNNTPFVAAGPGSELDPANYPAILGVETDLTNRARRAVSLLSASPRIGREDLLRIKFDTGYVREGYVKWMLDGIAALKLKDEPQLAAAQQLLAGWDFTADGNGAADALAVMVLERAMKNSYGLKDPPSPRAELEAAVAHLKTHFGRIDPPLGEVIRLRQGRTDLPMDGGGDTLRAATDWDVEPDGRLAIKHGDSFIMLAEWGPDGKVRSRSVQPYGAAITRPGSPHFADQAPLFVAKRFKPVWFERAEVLANASRRYRVSSGTATRGG